jgi:hypothetical protein
MNIKYEEHTANESYLVHLLNNKLAADCFPMLHLIHSVSMYSKHCVASNY